MTITYSDGRAVEAVLLSRTAKTLTVAMEGADDVMQFSDIKGVWVSEDCEPVLIKFAWEQSAPKAPVTEADCCCSHELAAKLIHMLFSGSDEDAIEVDGPIKPAKCMAAQLPC